MVLIYEAEIQPLNSEKFETFIFKPELLFMRENWILTNSPYLWIRNEIGMANFRKIAKTLGIHPSYHFRKFPSK